MIGFACVADDFRPAMSYQAEPGRLRIPRHTQRRDGDAKANSDAPSQGRLAEG